jgi:hypothetical protein
MDDNDNAHFLDQRVAFKSIASKLAPTGVASFTDLTGVTAP